MSATPPDPISEAPVGVEPTHGGFAIRGHMIELGRTSALADFIFEVGSDFDISFQIKSNGVSVDLTGSTFQFPFFRNGGKGDPEVDSINVSIADAVNGQIRLLFTASEIAALNFSNSEVSSSNLYIGRLLWTDNSGRKRRPLIAHIKISTGGK